jgi:hypothetical protein
VILEGGGMKRIFVLLLAASIIFSAFNLSAQEDAASTNNASNNVTGWPREIIDEEHTVLVYQPQIESWDNNLLTALAAVSVETKASPQPEYGTITISARTDVDKTNRIVTLAEVKITNCNFPAKPEMKDEYLQTINDHLPLGINNISLSLLESNLAITEAEEKTQKINVKNEPPKIIFSTTPAVLILIDGKPAMRQTEGTNLLRIVNTRALLLLDQSTGEYYLSIFGKWIKASNIDGPWAIVQEVPKSAEDIKDTLSKNNQVDLMEEPSDDIKQNLDNGILPKIYLTTVSAELLVTQGEFQMDPISGTQLLYVKNTQASIFLYTKTQEFFVLISGRWFKSQTTSGPWKYVSGSDLPLDFTKISETHPKGGILTSIPGTPQAQEAYIANTIPQTAEVKKSEANLSVKYDGKPQFKQIEDTSLQYAINCPTPVIRINETTYYAVDNGIWFSSSVPTGPWVISTNVPQVIYTIPVSSPLHYVTYVRIYDSTPDTVYIGYTPGYYGSYVNTDGIVVYGTGWYYPPYIGEVWIGAPVTYGFGAGFVEGCAFGFAAGYAWSAWCHPWWGPYWGHNWAGWGNQVNINHLNVYNKWGNNVTINRENIKNQISSWQGKNLKSMENVKNNVFAGHEGEVFRKDGDLWQKYSGGGKWNNFEDKGVREGVWLKNQDISRARGEFRDSSFHGGSEFRAESFKGGGAFRGGGFGRGGRR